MSVHNFGSKFRNDHRGSVAIFMGMAAVFLVSVASVALDYGGALRTRDKMQTRLDAAVILGVAQISATQTGVSEAQTYLTNSLINAKIDGILLSSDIKPSADGKGLDARAVMQYKTKLAAVLGFNTIDLRLQASASRPAGVRVLDVAMCIDATGSMQPTIDAVKANAMSFFPLLNGAPGMVRGAARHRLVGVVADR
jgi:Flp pilus assembly protein TadG